jgi:hypothetical protein
MTHPTILFVLICFISILLSLFSSMITDKLLNQVTCCLALWLGMMRSGTAYIFAADWSIEFSYMPLVVKIVQP